MAKPWTAFAEVKQAILSDIESSWVSIDISQSRNAMFCDCQGYRHRDDHMLFSPLVSSRQRSSSLVS